MKPISFKAHQTTVTILRIVLVLTGTLLLLTACTSIEQYVPDELQRGIENAATTLQVVIGLIGLALLLAGFALYEVLVQIIGFVIGGALGAVVGAMLAPDATWLGILLGLITGGSIGAGLSLFFTYLGLFIAGAFGGVMIFSGIWIALFNSEPGVLLIIMGIIVGGVLMIQLFRLWITALTAVLGAILFGISIGADPGWWLLFFAAGMAVQYGLANAVGKGDIVKPGYKKPSTT